MNNRPKIGARVLVKILTLDERYDMIIVEGSYTHIEHYI